MAEHELNKIVDDDGEVFNLRDSTKQPVADRVTAWGSTPSDTKYPSEKLVKTSLDGKANVADAELSTTSTNPLQNKEITRWHNIIIGDDGFVSDSAAYPQLSLQKLKLGALSHYNKGVNIKIYTYDEGDEENASLVFDIANASDRVKDNFYNGFSMDTLFQSEAGKYVKIVYTGSTSCYFRALGVFMDTKDTSSTVSYFYGHLRVRNVDYPESGQFSTWGSLVVAAFSKTSATVAELILRPKTSASKCRIFGFRCLNTYTGSDWAVLIGRATSALKLTNSRKLCVDLSRTADSTFDGSADQTNIPVKNTLPVASGGTGKTSVTAGNYLVGNGTNALTEKTPNAAANDLINALTTGESTPTDNDYYVAQYAGGGTTTKTFHRRPVKALWEYIKGKISSVLGLTETSYDGNAATATTASNVSSNGAASSSTARHVWFSDSATETKRVHDDNFKYTPSTNTLTANVSGNAASATTAAGYTSGGAIDTALQGKQDDLGIDSSSGDTSKFLNKKGQWATPYVDDSGFVHTTGTESVGGTKTFTSRPTVKTSSGDSAFVAQSPDGNYSVMFGVGSSGSRTGIYEKTSSRAGWLLELDENGDFLLPKYAGIGDGTHPVHFDSSGKATLCTREIPELALGGISNSGLSYNDILLKNGSKVSSIKSDSGYVSVGSRKEDGSTEGVTVLRLGNSTPKGTAGHSRGGLDLFDDKGRQISLRTSTNNQTSSPTTVRSLFLGDLSENSTVVHSKVDTQFGSAFRPVFVDAKGSVTACDFEVI